MMRETFFTLAEYKQNYDRLKKEFVDAYIDNDEDEFIQRQIEWYKICLKNTIAGRQFRGDTITYDTEPSITGENFVREVDLRIRNERGVIIAEVCQNLNVSFGKIIRFLLQKKQPTAQLSQAQLALYYYILHDQKLVPRFQRKIKEIEELSAQYGLHPKNFQLKYNEISNTKGQEGYSKDDVDVVKQLLEKNYPSALKFLEELTQHIY